MSRLGELIIVRGRVRLRHGADMQGNGASEPMILTWLPSDDSRIQRLSTDVHINEGSLMPRNELLDRLGIEQPIILAPMGGGPSTPELVAAVSNTGGLGSLGAAYLTPEQILSHIRKS